jgi:chaperonin GroEL
VAVIKVGAATESDMKERKNRFESALSATRAGIAEGLLPGGGVALLRAAEALKGFHLDVHDEEMGLRVLRVALEGPLRQICLNSGFEPATVLRRVRGEKNPKIGYDVLKDEYCDLVKEGVVDATKVVRVGLENAVSVATILLTSETLVTNAPKEEGDDEDFHHHHDEGGEDMGEF